MIRIAFCLVAVLAVTGCTVLGVTRDCVRDVRDGLLDREVDEGANERCAEAGADARDGLLDRL